MGSAPGAQDKLDTLNPEALRYDCAACGGPAAGHLLALALPHWRGPQAAAVSPAQAGVSGTSLPEGKNAQFRPKALWNQAAAGPKPYNLTRQK